MKAYKFRAASQFAFALDIIFNRRLYCADWRTLNDPMEGRFVCTDRGPNERDLEEEVAKITHGNWLRLYEATFRNNREEK